MSEKVLDTLLSPMVNIELFVKQSMLPLPDKPVIITNFLRGIARETPFRLWVLALLITISDTAIYLDSKIHHIHWNISYSIRK